MDDRGRSKVANDANKLAAIARIHSAELGAPEATPRRIDVDTEYGLDVGVALQQVRHPDSDVTAHTGDENTHEPTSSPVRVARSGTGSRRGSSPRRRGSW